MLRFHARSRASSGCAPQRAVRSPFVAGCVPPSTPSPRDPQRDVVRCESRERRHGLADIVERGVGSPLSCWPLRSLHLVGQIAPGARRRPYAAGVRMVSCSVRRSDGRRQASAIVDERPTPRGGWHGRSVTSRAPARAGQAARVPRRVDDRVPSGAPGGASARWTVLAGQKHGCGRRSAANCR